MKFQILLVFVLAINCASAKTLGASGVELDDEQPVVNRYEEELADGEREETEEDIDDDHDDQVLPECVSNWWNPAEEAIKAARRAAEAAARLAEAAARAAARAAEEAAREARRIAEEAAREAQRIAEEAARVAAKAAEEAAKEARRIAEEAARVAAEIAKKAAEQLHLKELQKLVVDVVGKLTKDVLGPIFGPLFDCVNPQLGACLKSLEVSGDKVSIGGKGSNCLGKRINTPFNEDVAPGVVLVGNVDSDIELKVASKFLHGAFKASMYTKVKLSGSLKVNLERGKKYIKEKTVYLIKEPKTVYRDLVMAGEVPLLIDITVQPKAIFKLKLHAEGKGNVEVPFQGEITLDGTNFEFDPTKAEIDFNKGSANSKSNLNVKYNLEGKAVMKARMSLGVEIVISIDGIPVKFFPKVTLGAFAKVEGMINQSKRCVAIEGYVKAGGLGITILPPMSVSVLGSFDSFKGSCKQLAGAGCELIKGSPASCFLGKLGIPDIIGAACDKLTGLCDIKLPRLPIPSIKYKSKEVTILEPVQIPIVTEHKCWPQ